MSTTPPGKLTGTQDHNGRGAMPSAVPGPGGTYKMLLHDKNNNGSLGEILQEETHSVHLCAIPLIIQTWERGRQGVSIPFLPFSTNTISSPLFALDPGLLPF